MMRETVFADQTGVGMATRLSYACFRRGDALALHKLRIATYKRAANSNGVLRLLNQWLSVVSRSRASCAI